MSPVPQITVSSETAGIKALKVRVNVIANEFFPGLHCAGQWWPEGVSDAVLTADAGATGEPVIDENTGAPQAIYTLEGKLSQLYTLEGRKRMGESPRLPKQWKSWSEPQFELPDTSGKDPGQAKLHRAPRKLRLEILDRQIEDGSWESEKASPGAIAAKATQPAQQPRK